MHLTYMKKGEKKTKTKTKLKKVTKQKQSQRQNVVVNILTSKTKARTTTRTVGPKPSSFLQTITTYPIFREALPQEPLHRNPESKPVANPLGFIDKTSIKTEQVIPEVSSETNLQMNSEVNTPAKNTPRSIAPLKKTPSRLIEEYDNLYTPSKFFGEKPSGVATPLPYNPGHNVSKLISGANLPRIPIARAQPLTPAEIQRKKDELNQKRRLAYAIKKNEKKK
jgi:hypothetical protein